MADQLALLAETLHLLQRHSAAEAVLKQLAVLVVQVQSTTVLQVQV